MKEIGIHESSLNKFRALPQLYAHFPALAETERLEGIHGAQIFQIAAGGTPDGATLVRKSRIDGDNALHVGIAQRLQYHSIEDTEHSCGGPDAQSKRHDSHRGKAWV